MISKKPRVESIKGLNNKFYLKREKIKLKTRVNIYKYISYQKNKRIKNDYMLIYEMNKFFKNKKKLNLIKEII